MKMWMFHMLWSKFYLLNFLFSHLHRTIGTFQPASTVAIHYGHNNNIANLLEWLTNFFIASLEIACPHSSLTGGLVSARRERGALASSKRQRPQFTWRLLSEYGASKHWVVPPLPAQVHLTGQLITTPNIRHLALCHHCLQTKQLWQCNAPSTQTEQEREGRKRKRRGGDKKTHRNLDLHN